MPIFGLTDRTPSFREIARLRKGAPKAQGLKDLDHFRPDFRPSEDAARRLFVERYGEQANDIEVRLAFPQIERVWQSWFMVYNTAGLLGKAGVIAGRESEGRLWVYLRNNKTGELLVKDGQVTPAGQRAGISQAFDPYTPVYSYFSPKHKKDIPVYAKPEGRLSVLVPALKVLNYVTVLTHSIYDVMRIEDQLLSIQEVAERVGMTLPMVPIILRRRWEKVSIAYDDKKRMEDKCLINLDAAPDWAAAQFQLLDTVKPGMLLAAPRPVELLLPGKSPAQPAALLEPEEPAIEPGPETYLDDYGDLDDGESESESWDEPRSEERAAPVAQPEPAPQPAGGRPYAPEVLRAKLLERGRLSAGKVTPKQRGLLAMLIGQAFAGEEQHELMRHAVQMYLYGSASLNDVPDGLVLASINDWIAPVRDTGGEYQLSPIIAREIQAVYRAAIANQGQQNLPGL